MRAITKKVATAKPSFEVQIQLRKLDEGNFSLFERLLPYSEWTSEERPLLKLPAHRAREMAEMSANAASGCGVWIIYDQQSLEAVGALTMAPVFHMGCRQIGFWVLPEYQKRGYATLALRAMCQFGFESLHLARIQAQVITGNAASIRVLEKAGFAREGLLRASHRGSDGVTVDAYMYAKMME